jgi:hypothetical protein
VLRGRGLVDNQDVTVKFVGRLPENAKGSLTAVDIGQWPTAEGGIWEGRRNRRLSSSMEEGTR